MRGGQRARRLNQGQACGREAREKTVAGVRGRLPTRAKGQRQRPGGEQTEGPGLCGERLPGDRRWGRTALPSPELSYGFAQGGEEPPAWLQEAPSRQLSRASKGWNFPCFTPVIWMRASKRNT